MGNSAPWSKTWTFLDGAWLEGNVPIMGPRTHALWLASSVFDGARAFEGVAPDLDSHCARVNQSAEIMWLRPCVTVDKWLELVKSGLKRFDPQSALYIRPMYWAEQGGPASVSPDPDFDPLVPHALRSANAESNRILYHALALPSADD